MQVITEKTATSDLPNQSNSVMKVQMSIIRTGIAMAGLSPKVAAKVAVKVAIKVAEKASVKVAVKVLIIKYYLLLLLLRLLV